VRRAAFVAAALGAALALGAGGAAAQPADPPEGAPPGDAPPAAPGSRVEAQLEKGFQQFQDLEYGAAIETLRSVRLDQQATRAQKLRALELVGISYLILGQRTRAEEAFEDLLTIDPGYQLQHDDGSPKIREFFAEVRRKVVPGAGAGMEVRLEHAAPSEAVAGREVEIEAIVRGGLEQVVDLVVRWRRRGVLDYGTAPMRREGGQGDRWRARFVPPPSRTRYAVDYYVEARNAAGGAVGRIGGPETPLALPVAPGEADVSEPGPWYTRWYVIAGGAAVLGIATTAIVLSTGGDPGDGTLDPGRVTLTP